jgi:hypothetical protein
MRNKTKVYFVKPKAYILRFTYVHQQLMVSYISNYLLVYLDYSKQDNALQGFRSIAIKSIAMVIFHGIIIQYYHELSGCGSRTLIFPRLFLVAINYHFIAVDASYCNKLYRG